MLTFKRALIAAAFLLTTLYLITRSHPDLSEDSRKEYTVVDRLDHDIPEAKTSFAPVTTSSSTVSSQAKKPATNQQSMQALSKLSLIERLAYQFPYDVETKFPAYIWQTWKYTPASQEFEDEFRPAEASWTEKHPGFIHEVITDHVVVHLMQHLYASVPEVLEAYEALPTPILKADFFRYLILLARGGIYSDIDTHAIKSALEWIPANVPHEAVGLVIGIEADPDRTDWYDWYSRRIQFCQWTIQSKSGHPVLREIVAHITNKTLVRKRAGTLKALASDDEVVAFTGPAIWTDIIFNFFNDERYFDMRKSSKNITWEDFTGMTAPKKVGDVVILPITSFSPGVEQMGAGDYDHPMAFVKHDFEGMLASRFLHFLLFLNISTIISSLIQPRDLETEPPPPHRPNPGRTKCNKRSERYTLTLHYTKISINGHFFI
jgi:alpha 1,6-mannosyltransferase